VIITQLDDITQLGDFFVTRWG